MPKHHSELAQPLVASGGGEEGSTPSRFDGRVTGILGALSNPTQQLVRTASAERDIEAARAASPGMRESVVQRQATQAQQLRVQLRLIDADIIEVRAQLQRAALLRGPSGERRVCDADCVAAGCGEEFPEEDGVLCECGLFLCFECFGVMVNSECQIGGRFDKDLSIDGQRSPTGALPCSLFPQQCSVGHVAMSVIQKAMLADVNRGEDGEAEDRRRQGQGPVVHHDLGEPEERSSPLEIRDLPPRRHLCGNRDVAVGAPGGDAGENVGAGGHDP